MDIVFFGSSKFSVPFLDALLTSRHRILAVITQPDRPKGRGLKLASTEVKDFALGKNLKLFQPDKLNKKENISFLEELKPDLFVVVAYGEILSREVLEVPKLFSINVHASLLPKYRGASPVARAIINGERSTGVTIIKMDEGLDSGPIVMQKKVTILEEDNTKDLEEKLSDLGKELLLESVEQISRNNFSLQTQAKLDLVSFAPKLKKEDGQIQWSKPAVEINNLIRGCFIWPNAFTYYRGKRLKIFKAKVFPSVKSVAAVGSVIKADKNGILVASGKDSLLITQLQLEGKKRISAGEFLAGHKISAGEVFTNK